MANKLTSREQKFKDFIKKGNYSTDCGVVVFWCSNPYSIQPYMQSNNIDMKSLEKVLDDINSENKIKIEEMLKTRNQNEDENDPFLNEIIL